MIVAIGNPVYDDIQTPMIASAGRVLSGCSTNGCLALTRLGRQTLLVGRIGHDLLERFRYEMDHYGVALAVEPCAESGGFRLIYDARGDRTLDVLGVAEPIQHLPATISDAAAVIVGPILGETPPALIERLTRASQAPIFLDPQGMLRTIGDDGRIVHRLTPEFGAVAAGCQVVKANELETAVITGIDPRTRPAAAARALRELGCQIAIVTLAEAGSVIDDGTRQYTIPAYATIARDPTGAGDTYMAGFIDAYLEAPDDLYAAGCRGAATASIWIEHSGPDAPISVAEVDRRTAVLRASM